MTKAHISAVAPRPAFATQSDAIMARLHGSPVGPATKPPAGFDPDAALARLHSPDTPHDTTGASDTPFAPADDALTRSLARVKPARGRASSPPTVAGLDPSQLPHLPGGVARSAQPHAVALARTTQGSTVAVGPDAVGMQMLEAAKRDLGIPAQVSTPSAFPSFPMKSEPKQETRLGAVHKTAAVHERSQSKLARLGEAIDRAFDTPLEARLERTESDNFWPASPGTIDIHETIAPGFTMTTRISTEKVVDAESIPNVFIAGDAPTPSPVIEATPVVNPTPLGRIFELFEGRDGKHYWHAKAPNGLITFASQGYTERASAERAIHAELSALGATAAPDIVYLGKPSEAEDAARAEREAARNAERPRNNEVAAKAATVGEVSEIEQRAAEVKVAAEAVAAKGPVKAAAVAPLARAKANIKKAEQSVSKVSGVTAAAKPAAKAPTKPAVKSAAPAKSAAKKPR